MFSPSRPTTHCLLSLNTLNWAQYSPRVFSRWYTNMPQPPTDTSHQASPRPRAFTPSQEAGTTGICRLMSRWSSSEPEQYGCNQETSPCCPHEAKVILAYVCRPVIGNEIITSDHIGRPVDKLSADIDINQCMKLTHVISDATAVWKNSPMAHITLER